MARRTDHALTPIPRGLFWAAVPLMLMVSGELLTMGFAGGPRGAGWLWLAAAVALMFGAGVVTGLLIATRPAAGSKRIEVDGLMVRPRIMRMISHPRTWMRVEDSPR